MESSSATIVFWSIIGFWLAINIYCIIQDRFEYALLEVVKKTYNGLLSVLQDKPPLLETLLVILPISICIISLSVIILPSLIFAQTAQSIESLIVALVTRLNKKTKEFRTVASFGALHRVPMKHKKDFIAGRKWKKPKPNNLKKTSKKISKLTKKKPSKKFFDDIDKTKRKS